MGSDPPSDPRWSGHLSRHCGSNLPGAVGRGGELRTAFKLALRLAEGLILSVVELLGCEFAAPITRSVSRQAARLESIICGPLPQRPRLLAGIAALGLMTSQCKPAG